MFLRRLSLLSILGLAVAGCGGDDGGPTGPAGDPAEIEGVGGQGQTVVVGNTLPQPVVARVVDAEDRPVEGVSIRFLVLTGGGTISPIDGSGSETSIRLTTASDGTAGVEWTLGTLAGQQQLRVEVEDLRSILFTATAEPGPPTQFSAAPVPAGAAGEELPDALTVRVQDEFGNGIPDLELAWQVVAGGGSLSASASTTDAAGRARSRLTLGGTAGLNEVTASVAGFSPLTLSSVGVAPSSDPRGDARASFGTSADITRIGALVVDNQLIVWVEFENFVLPNDPPADESIAGFFELDTDQSSATGAESVSVNLFGSTLSLGVEFIVQLVLNDANRYPVVRTSDQTETGEVDPTFSANTLTLPIPLSALGGDDGVADVALLVASGGAFTDLAPDNGTLTVP